MSISDVVGDDVNIAQELDNAPQVEETEPEVVSAPETVEPEASAPAVEKSVPLAALHEERQKRRELSQQLEAEKAERERMARVFEERFAALTKKPEPEAPAWEENPAEHLRHQIGQVAQTAQATQEQIKQWQESQRQQAVVQQLATRVTSAEAEFQTENPDYHDAVKYLNEFRVRELTVLGLSPEQAREKSGRELMQAAFEFAQAGRNPAEIAYNLAKARGYAKPAAPATSKFDTQRQGVQASKSLGSGGAPSNQLTAQQLLSMSDEEFSEAVGSDAKWRKLMGG